VTRLPAGVAARGFYAAFFLCRGKSLNPILGPMLAGLLALGALWSLPVLAQEIPLNIGVTNEIVDEFGAKLVGNILSPATNCDLVEIRYANSGIFPPDYDGNADPNNPLVSQTTIGGMMAPGLIEPARFAAVFMDPKPSGTIFVRVFNAPTLAAASFYGDSQAMPVPAGIYDMVAAISATTNPIDPRDPDNDGLNNSWEKSYGSDPTKWDSDGDGMRDGDEPRAGTDLLDINSVFIMAWVRADENNDAVIGWDSVAGKQYQVEYTVDDLKENPVYNNVSAVITAVGPITETVVTNGFANENGSYRVRLVEP